MSLKPILFLLLFTTVFFNAWSQTIIINGQESDGKLTWANFTEPVDPSSSFAAYTSYSYKTKYNSVKYEGNNATIEGFNVITGIGCSKNLGYHEKSN